MQEYIRALIVIFVLSAFGFYLAKKILQGQVPANEFKRWRNVWLALTVVAFLAGNFYIYITVGSFLILFLSRGSISKAALFFVLLFAIPPVGIVLPGLGLVNYLFTLTHPRFIELIILLPAAITVARNSDFRFGKILTDKFLILYLLIIVALELRDTTLTDSLRKSFYLFLDAFLPYYVASRGIKDISQMKTAIAGFITSAIVISVIALFEYLKHWLLYSPLNFALGAGENATLYLGRAGEIRSVTTFSHSIVLGYFMTIALGLYLFLSSQIANIKYRRLGFLLIILGLVAPLSRGPWLGAAAMIVLFFLQGPQPFKKIGTLTFAGILVIIMLAILPSGQKYIDLIPFVGSAEKGNVEYRQQLFHNSMIVIGRNPLFGSSNYIEAPEMQEMIQGQGIIDIVNSYLRIALETGYVGLCLFVAIFISTIFRIRSVMKLCKDKRHPEHILGRSLVAIVFSIMIMLATVSTIGTVSNIYWAILGVGIAYSRFLPTQARAMNGHAPAVR